MHHLFKSPLTGKCSQCGDRNPIVSGVKLHEFLTSRVSKMFSPVFCLFIYLFLFIFIYFYLFLFIFIYFYLFIFVYFYLFIYLFMHLFIHLFLCFVYLLLNFT